VPNGRVNSTNGTVVASGGDSNLSFSFNFAAGQSFTIYSGFKRFIRTSDGSMSVSMSASHSLLGSSTATISNIPQVVTVVNRTISFNGNGGSSPGSQTVSEGSTISLPSTSRSGYTFDYWIIGGSAYSAGQNYTVNSDVTATASWTANTPAPVFTDGLNFSSQLTVGSYYYEPFTANNTTSYQLLQTVSGLSIGNANSSSAYIFGTVSASPGSYTISVRANGPGGSTDTQQSVTVVAAPPSWSDTSVSSTARIGTFYSANFSATNATSWIISQPPPGITTSGTFSSTVTLSGTPTNSGNYTVNATPYNSSNVAGSTESFSITVSPRIPLWSDTSLTLTARVGVYYSSSVSANYVHNWSTTGLPTSGLSFSSNTGETSLSTSNLFGTPTAFGTKNIGLTPRNSSNESAATENYAIVISDAALSWADQALSTTTVVQDEAYSDQVSVQSGPVSVTYSETPGSALPTGLSVNSATGAITGAVATPGVYTFRIRSTNGSSEILDTNFLSLTVEAAGGYVKVWNGSAWVDGTVNVRTAGAWVEGTTQIRNSSNGWTPSFSS